MKNNSISQFLGAAIRVFRRFNVTIFIVMMVCGLAAAVYVLTNILKTPTSTSNNGNTTSQRTTFDDETIKKLDNLDSQSTAIPTQGRVNPFSE